MIKEKLEEIHSILGEFIIKADVAEKEMADSTSSQEYIEQIRLRLKARFDALALALNSIKEQI